MSVLRIQYSKLSMKIVSQKRLCVFHLTQIWAWHWNSACNTTYTFEMHDICASMHKQVVHSKSWIPKLWKFWMYYTSISFSTLMWNGNKCVQEFVFCIQMSLKFARSRRCKFWQRENRILGDKTRYFALLLTKTWSMNKVYLTKYQLFSLMHQKWFLNNSRIKWAVQLIILC